MVDFGVFDHLDRRAGVPDQTIYEDRLRLISAYDEAGIADLRARGALGPDQ